MQAGLASICPSKQHVSAHRVTAKKMAPLYAGLASLLRKSSAAALKAADSRGSITGCLVLQG